MKKIILGFLTLIIIIGVILFVQNNYTDSVPTTPVVSSETGLKALGFTTSSEVNVALKAIGSTQESNNPEETQPEKYSKNEHGVKITVDPTSFEGNSYVYKDTIVGYHRTENSVVELYLKKNGKKNIVASDIGLEDPKPFEIFEVDKEIYLPNIAHTSLSYGDMGGANKTNYFIDIETGELLSIEWGGGAYPGAIRIKNTSKDYTISMDIVDACIQKDGKISGHATLKNLLLNNKPLNLPGTTKNLSCSNGEGALGPNYIFPDIQNLSIGNISGEKIKNVSDLNKLYFTVVQRDYSKESVNDIYPTIWENFYSLNLQTGEVNEISKDIAQKNVGYSF